MQFAQIHGTSPYVILRMNFSPLPNESQSSDAWCIARAHSGDSRVGVHLSKLYYFRDADFTWRLTTGFNSFTIPHGKMVLHAANAVHIFE